MKKPGKLFIISAPSGGGKTTISREVIRRMKSTHAIEKVITYTTRPPREGELNGKDYHFLSREEFIKKKHKGFFLETTEYHGNLYGSPSSIFEHMQQGYSFVMATDLPGVKAIKQRVAHAILIWIAVPCIDELRKRLEKRGKQTAQAIEERIALAQHEITQADASNLFNYSIRQ